MSVDLDARLAEIRAERDNALDVIENVWKLHSRRTFGDHLRGTAVAYCRECGKRTAWPCATILALEGRPDVKPEVTA